MIHQNKNVEAQPSFSTRSNWIYRIYGKVLWILKEFFSHLKINNAAFYVIGSVAKGEPSCIRVCINKDSCLLKISELNLLVFDYIPP